MNAVHGDQRSPDGEPSDSPDAEVSVVVVTYSPGETLAPFVASLRDATQRRIRVVLADNGSTDGVPQSVAEASPDVRLLATGGNLGYGRAANLGVAATTSDWVVIANPDIVWTPGAIDELLAAADRWPRAGAIGPMIRTPLGEIYPSARQLPSLTRGIGHALFGWFWPGNPWTIAYREERAAPHERVAGWLSGACLLVRREAFDSVSGFDPRYFMYFEDVDLGDRLASAGWLNIYAPSAEVIHEGSHSTARHADAMSIEHHRSAYRYLSDRHRGSAWAPVRVVLRLGLFSRSRLARPLASIAQRRLISRDRSEVGNTDDGHHPGTIPEATRPTVDTTETIAKKMTTDNHDAYEGGS